MRKAVWVLGVLSLVLTVSNLLLWTQLRRAQGDPRISATNVVSPAQLHPDRSKSQHWNTLQRGHRRGSRTDGQPTPDADPDLYGRVQRDPRFQAAMVDYQRIDIRQQYSAFLSSLGLSAEKEDQLVMILAQQRVRGAQGIPQEYTREAWQRKNDDELRAVLSQPQVDAFRRYRDTAAVREQVLSLRDELMATRDPLRDDQVELLVDALHPEELQFMAEVRAFNEGLDKSAEALPDSERKFENYFAERETAATERKLAAAGTILSRAQLKALGRRLETQQAMGRQGSKLRRLQFELAKTMGQSSEPEAPPN